MKGLTLASIKRKRRNLLNSNKRQDRLSFGDFRGESLLKKGGRSLKKSPGDDFTGM